MVLVEGEPGGMRDPRGKRNQEQNNDQDTRHKRGHHLEMFLHVDESFDIWKIIRARGNQNSSQECHL